MPTHTLPLHTTSSELFERAKKVIPGGVNSPVRAFKSVGGSPFFTAKAQGAHLITVDGQTLIDFVGSWGPAIHGHNHPSITQAILNALQNAPLYGTPSPSEVLLAEKITQLVPSIQKIRMVSSGTEATMSCLRLARAYTKKNKIIKFSGCYHGHVDSLLVKAGSGASTFGSPDSAGVPPSFASDTLVVPYNNIHAVHSLFQEFPDSIAAIILEPYPGNCGVLTPQNNFLQKLRNLCDEFNSLLIFDEVMTGFRISLGGVQEKENTTPDLTALGKIIGGGLPVGAFGGKSDIMDLLSPLGPVYQGGTYSGNPLGMSAGLASLKLLEDSPPYSCLESLVSTLESAITSAAHKKGLPLQFNKAGSMFSFFFSEIPISSYEDVLQSNKSLFNKVFHYALNHGLFLPPSPFEAAFLGTAHSPQIINQAAETLHAAISSL